MYVLGEEVGRAIFLSKFFLGSDHLRIVFLNWLHLGHAWLAVLQFIFCHFILFRNFLEVIAQPLFINVPSLSFFGSCGKQ